MPISGRFLIGAMVLSLLASGPGSAAPGLPGFPSSLNVRSFGATGDGVTDDTKAIQAAADAAVGMEAGTRTRLGTARGLAAGSKASSYPEIYFPDGNYRITETIVLQQSVYVRGSGKATIQQTHPAKDVFYVHYSFRIGVENLTFQGGKTQLRFWTGNVWSKIYVRDCRFLDSSDYAIVCTSFVEGSGEGKPSRSSKPVPPYTFEMIDGLARLTPVPLPNPVEWYNSTLLAIEGCQFENCLKAANVACDTTVLRDIAITTNPEMEGAAFFLGGQCHVYNLRGMARVNPTRAQHWIDAEGNIALRKVTLDTDAEAGIGFVVSSITPRPTGRGIRLEDCRVKVAGSRQNALLWIKPGTMPNIISMRNVIETSGRPVEAIAWAETPTAGGLEDIKFYGGVPLDAQFKISFSTNSPNISEKVPEAIVGLIEPALSADVVPDVAVEELAWREPDFDRIIHAEEHGIDPKSSADQTEEIQKFFDLAGESGSPLLVFPGSASYTVSDTIRLPKKVNVRTAGAAFFVQTNPEKDLFQIENAEEIVFRNCDFVGGRRAFAISTQPDVPAFVQFDYCSFFDQRDKAVQCLSESGEAESENLTSILIKNAIFSARQALVTNANNAQVDTLWGVTDPHLSEAAYIENRGGKMRVQAMLGNPRLWHGERAKPPETIKEWPHGRDIRWIDNWGKLHVQDVRFGGESGGMCNVFNRSEQGMVYVSGGLTRFNNGATKRCILFAEKVPSQIVLRDISSSPGKSDDTAGRVIGADGKPLDPEKSKIYVSGVMAPP